jgi:hypothetical protein
MAFLAASDAVVIDLRGVPGGSPDLVTLLVSYFLGADPVKLMTSYNRAADATAERWSVRDLPGRRMTGVPLYVLQDANSASAAEMLSYFVQRQQVGTVVGETSAGAGNGGARLSVGAGLALFVPQMRIVDGPGWEQSGVTPDVRAPGDSALAVAHRLALERLIASAATAEARREREWALELARAAGRPARSDDADLRAYAGTFGARAFAPRDGALTLVGATGRTTRLVEVDRGVFRAREARYRFERDAAGRVTAVTVETLAGRRARDERAG